jgi:hypothetical protein
MFRFMLLAASVLDAALAAAAPVPRFPGRPDKQEGPPGAPAAPAQSIAPISDLDDPLDARDLARAMFEVSRSNPKHNARQRLEVVRYIHHWETNRYHCSEVEPTFDYLLGLSRRWRAAELALSESPAERAAAYQRFWQDAWSTERMAKAKFDCGRILLEHLKANEYEQLTAALEWARAGAGKEKTRLLGEAYPGLAPPEVPFDERVAPHRAWAKAQFEVSQADLGELARQRVAAVRAVYWAKLKWYLIVKEDLDDLLDVAVHLAEAELAVPGDKVDAAAARERAWEMAWIAHEITRRHIKAHERNSAVSLWHDAPELLAESRYALLQAEIALVQAGQARRPGRVSTLLKEPDLAKLFDVDVLAYARERMGGAVVDHLLRPVDAKVLAQARAELARADLNDLLRQRLEMARKGYRAGWEAFRTYKRSLDDVLDWSRRLLDAELALTDGPAGREAAFARHWKRVWQFEALCRNRYGEGPGATAGLMMIRHARLEAELLWAPWQARK